MDQTNMNLYKIPFLEEITKNEKNTVNKGDLTIIGIIDASGSMSNCWGWLANFWNKSIPKDNLIAITFSNYPTVLKDNKELYTDIGKHGGGGTEIVPAFVEFEKQLANVPIDNIVTVIFISDGQDNSVKTLDTRMKTQLKGNILNHRINFICLGVEKGFPTNLSMNLRELYHRGDPQIPAIYLIEYSSEQAFFNKFETMKSYFYPARVFQLNQYVNLYPYDEQITKEVFEGQWCICYKNDLRIISDNLNIQLESIKEDQLEIENVIDIFRSWVQNLQIKIIQQKQQLTNQCEKCLEIMKRIIGHLNAKFGFDILNISQNEILNQNKPFHLRVKVSFVYKYCTKILFFVNEIEALIKGVDPKQLSEFEQAKRLMIGTITGKHLQKALALKGITIEEFQNIKQEFINILKNSQFNKQNEQGQERSVITLENQRDILINTAQMEESMKYIKSQYDFAETFPLIGQGIKVKRYEGSQVNPWLVNVIQFAKQNKIIDSGYLIKNNFQIQLNVGGIQQEEINCILPLFNEADQDLQPVLRSRIIKLLMTFMVQQNVDTLYEESYLALLANSLIYILQQPDSQWKFEHLELIYSTTKIVYGGTKQFEDYLNKIINNPIKAFFEKDQEYEQFIALPKAVIYIFYAIRSELIQIQDFEKYIAFLILYSLSILQSRNPNFKNDCFKTQLSQEDELELKIHFEPQFQECLYLKDFRNSFQQNLKILLQKQLPKLKVSINLNKDILYNSDQKFNFKSIEGLYQLVLKQQFDVNQYKYYLNHILTNNNQQEIFTKPVDFTADDQIRNLMVLNEQQYQQFDFIRDQLENLYLKNFFDTHIIVAPLTKQELIQECEKKGVDVNQIVFNEQLGLAKNCCMSKQCPFYLKPMEIQIFRKHLHNWQDLYPGGFHAHVLHRIAQGKTNDEIFNNAKLLYPGFPEKFHGTQEQSYQYIQIIREFQKKYIEQ
ncbi:unnamed protein product [Paramecium pentaurelia]|uniref:VWFA domain-containing protein n=1 Tax=Paramecium pentaurelia TaxID=43138 RepID=A0A8S1SVV2_9CILI|nr:unnamed protein product [Paramecium pentaurelia]